MGALSFLHPFVLAGLGLLPLLWFLLRVTPPAPRRVRFPAARFLAGLTPVEQSPSKTPWWILVMRVMLLGLIIIALARPVLNQGTALPGTGDIFIVIDNGWDAAPNWHDLMAQAHDIAERAGRAERAIHIMTTAPEPATSRVQIHGPLSQGQAEAILRGLTPHPFPADYAQASAIRAEIKGDIFSLFLSSGLRDDKNHATFISTLERRGGAHVMVPDQARLPLILRAVHENADLENAQGPFVMIEAPAGLPPRLPVAIHSLDSNGRIIDMHETILDTTTKASAIGLNIPKSMRGTLARIIIAGQDSAGATLAIDDRFAHHTVGLVAPDGHDSTTPLVGEGFYLSRALSPYADVKTGSVGALIAQNPAVIILPDTSAMPPVDLNMLENWVKKGGLLLRFAGPLMSQGDEFLTPVPLRMGGGRAMDGALTWEKPLPLAPFPAQSPYHGLPVPEDVSVSRQILADPVEGLAQKSWAVLEDGTPLITADRLERGMIVLVHTTATPEWSDLALSGTFVQILRRTIAMAGGAQGAFDSKGGALNPLRMLDGFGRFVAPGADIRPLPPEAAQDINAFTPGPHHPPGLYGAGGWRQSFNLGDVLPAPQSFTRLPGGAAVQVIGQMRETSLMHYFLYGALALFFVDWCSMILMQAGFRFLRRPAYKMTMFGAGLGVLFLLAAPPAHAMDEAKLAAGFHLAYVQTGDAAIDETSRRGLETMMHVLNRRTSIEPVGVAEVDVDRDGLAFFPLLYWPVPENAQDLSPDAIRNVQNYLDHGGVILFDLRDGQMQGARQNALRRITGGLNIRPIRQMPDDHVVRKSFYLLSGTPGRHEDGVMWVEEESEQGRDGVSAVLIGSQDWAGAWMQAGMESGLMNARPGQFLSIYGHNPQQEMALRFGVNVVMYALTGNYKADQVHLPHILERLGR